MRKHPAATRILLACVTLAVACSSKEPPKPAASLSAKNAEKAQPVGHLKLPSNEPEFLNPILETRFNRAIPLIFEGLVGLDATLGPVPRLAEKWSISKDRNTVTFNLRRGVTWHDGKPFSSADVKFTFDAMRDYTGRSLWNGYFTDVAELTAPNSHTVVVRYSKPYTPALSAWTMGILPKHLFEGAEFAKAAANREPVGTGPFKLARWEGGKRLLFEANDTWWNGAPKLSSIELNVDGRESLKSLTDNDLHFAQIDDVTAWVRGSSDPQFREKFETTSQVESRIRLIAWNTQRKPFDNIDVRQALTQSLNRQRIIDELLMGQAQTLSAPLFPNMFGYDHTVPPHAFDLRAAAKALESSGLSAKDGLRFSIDLITTMDDEVSTEMLAVFRRDLETVGVELKITTLSSAAFGERAILRDYDAVYLGWLPDIADPDPYSLLHSSQITGGPNFAAYASAAADELLENARSAATRKERRALYADLHKLLHDDLPYTALYAPFGNYAWSRQVRAANPVDVGAQPRFPGIAGWWLESTSAPAN